MALFENYDKHLFSHKSRDVLEFNGIPDFNEVEKAARAMKALVEKR